MHSWMLGSLAALLIAASGGASSQGELHAVAEGYHLALLDRAPESEAMVALRARLWKTALVAAQLRASLRRAELGPAIEIRPTPIPLPGSEPDPVSDLCPPDDPLPPSSWDGHPLVYLWDATVVAIDSCGTITGCVVDDVMIPALPEEAYSVLVDYRASVALCTEG